MDMQETPLQRLARHPILTRAQEADLARRIAAGDAWARDELVRCNMRLVLKSAWARARATGVDVEDLVQVGVLGLLTAIDKFEWERGHKFSTYATWWINQSMERALKDMRPGMRMALEIHGKFRILGQAESHLRAEALGRAPHVDDIQRLTGMDAAEIAQVREWRSRTLASLDRPLREDTDATLADIIPDPAAPDMGVRVGQQDERAQVEALLGQLAPREQRILVMRFGLDGGRCRNLAEVGREVGLSPIAVRRLERSIIQRLRASAEEQECLVAP